MEKKMNRIFEVLITAFVISTFFFSCAKKPLTLDKDTPMKTLLKASDEEITELIVKEAKEKPAAKAASAEKTPPKENKEKTANKAAPAAKPVAPKEKDSAKGKQ